VTISDVFVAVAVRSDPVRVTGVYRCPLPFGAEGVDEQAGVQAAADDARRTLRLSTGTPVVLALDPIERHVAVGLDDGWGRRPLPVRVDRAAVEGLDAAGFVVDRFDSLPAALARFAWASRHHQGRIHASGWTVTATAETLTATADGTPAVTGGPTDRRHQGLTDLTGVRFPRAVRRHVRIDSDAGAIGAALRSLGFQPDLMVDPTDDPTLSPSCRTTLHEADLSPSPPTGITSRT